MAAGDSSRVKEAQELVKTDPRKAEAAFREIISKAPTATSDAATREYEAALISLGELYRDEKKTQELVTLVQESRTVFSSFAKAKSAKLVRQLLDLFKDIPNSVDVEIAVTKDCIEWATSERRAFQRQDLQVRLVTLYMSKQTYYDALTLINGLLRELKRLDDKLRLVEVQLLESRLGSDTFIRNHLRRLYDALLEQNLIKVIEPFSRVEIDHIAKMVGLDTQQVERKLSQMILDKVIIGVLDQGAGCLIIYDETQRDESYDAALATIEKLSNVVDVLYTNQASLLE
ncbi:hypothetical protein M440DRAFT_1460961 [Trichoderma longibrachiatum ATCC 18648]|uniref:PCI domain-containing protein n=1 Tax=Trichoderma longibrachiatum ATCC 18648 TaxID=983965 RepID=A0A2T4CCZ4_TRILO|nr:hypothetical protein M440DRAFT_1460961 [Trichoderma longibrachiatum ATCC 18648]